MNESAMNMLYRNYHKMVVFCSPGARGQHVFGKALRVASVRIFKNLVFNHVVFDCSDKEYISFPIILFTGVKDILICRMPEKMWLNVFFEFTSSLKYTTITQKDKLPYIIFQRKFQNTVEPLILGDTLWFEVSVRSIEVSPE